MQGQLKFLLIIFTFLGICTPIDVIVSGLPLVLHDLQELLSRERTLSSLTSLNNIISSSQEEIDFLYRSDGIHVIVSLLEKDSSLANICLKILANASKRHEKLRNSLLNKNTFHILTVKLKSEVDFSKSNLILYSALIVVLVQGNYEAQNLMRTSGCLSSLVHILSCILDEAENKPPPCKNIELIIYAIIASIKDPRQPENQATVGRITPKLLKYLGKQTPFSGADQLKIAKCLWLLLKYALDQNKINQQVFLEHSGIGVLFRSIQDVVDEKKCEEKGDLLVKITGVLIKLKSHTDFLSQASSHCPLMILCNLLKTGNSLVVQQSIIFLDSLTREIPRALQIIKDEETLRGIIRAKIMFLKSFSRAKEFCQNLLNRIEMPDGTPTFQEEFNPSKHFGFTSKKESLISYDFNFDFAWLKNNGCVVHDSDSLNTAQRYSNSSLDSVESSEGLESIFKNENLSIETPSEHLNRHFRSKQENLRKIERHNVFGPPKKRINGLNIRRLLSRKISQIFQKFCAFIGVGVSVTDLRKISTVG